MSETDLKRDIQSAMRAREPPLTIGKKYLELSEYYSKANNEPGCRRARETALKLMLGDRVVCHNTFHGHLRSLLHVLATAGEDPQTHARGMLAMAHRMARVFDCREDCKRLCLHCSQLGNRKHVNDDNLVEPVVFDAAHRQIRKLQEIVAIIQAVQRRMYIPVSNFRLPLGVLDNVAIAAQEFSGKSLRDKPTTFPKQLRPLVSLLQSVVTEEPMVKIVSKWNTASSTGSFARMGELSAILCADRGYALNMLDDLLKKWKCIPSRFAVRTILSVAQKIRCRAMVQVEPADTRGLLSELLKSIVEPLQHLYTFTVEATPRGSSAKRDARTLYILHGIQNHVVWNHVACNNRGSSIVLGDLDTLLTLQARFLQVHDRESTLLPITAVSHVDHAANLDHETGVYLPTTGIWVVVDETVYHEKIPGGLVLTKGQRRERTLHENLRVSVSERWQRGPLHETIQRLKSLDEAVDFLKGIAFVAYQILQRYPDRCADILARGGLMSRLLWTEEVYPTLSLLLETPRGDDRETIYLPILYYGICKTHGFLSPSTSAP